MSGRGEGGQDGCERRIEVFVKIQKKNGEGGWSGGVGVGGRGRLGGVRLDVKERIEVFVKIQKKNWGGGGSGSGVGGFGFGGGVGLGGGGRMDVKEELKFL